jgi:hypothetical protein
LGGVHKEPLTAEDTVASRRKRRRAFHFKVAKKDRKVRKENLPNASKLDRALPEALILPTTNRQRPIAGD